MRLPAALFAIVMLLGISLATGPAEAQVYKWKDANGQTVYSDTPAPGQAAAPTRPPAPKPAAPTVRNVPSRAVVAVASGGSATPAQCLAANLAQLRALGCGIEQAGCPALREYQSETADGIERRRSRWQARPDQARTLDTRVNGQVVALLRSRGC
ncbi:DUF4124 domain-containing protein [Montanilutibacter psychrotolerans]|uniref:DUF4124 domain-containing protein n=1 Tax=Montanilutibacter psychrotolerans TaxID=1327343 RepID=A0A3M8SRG9_9GAMM|nr:DUF4124 domain-containing protein [Lysobacter psychrotolerans]RNF83363.1 DUF4124 domain-containing protein [Lysobacter psychrotolerans]